MFDNIQTLCLGLAAVIDTALLLSLFERRNWRRVPVSVVVLTSSVWLLHTATFFYLLLYELSSPWTERMRWLAMSSMVVALITLPCSLVHVFLRLRFSGFERRPLSDFRYALLYLPVLGMGSLSQRLAQDSEAGFLDLFAPFIRPYMITLCIVFGLAAYGALRLRRKLESSKAGSFFGWLATVLVASILVLLFTSAYALESWPDWREQLILVNVMLPIIPSVLFAYFVVRFNFMGLVLERTAVYGVIVVGVVLFHHLAVADLASLAGERYRIDFFILEGIAAVLLIILYQPLRQRTSEALRYLMGIRVSEVRDGTRELAYRLSSLAGNPPGELLSWFADAARSAMQLSYVAGWQITSTYAVCARAGESHRLSDESVVEIFRSLAAEGRRYYSRYDAPGEQILEVLETNQASLVVSFAQEEISGLFLFGRRTRRQDLGEEDINIILILVEQLRGTLINSRLQAERLAAERQAFQNEKLSTMGLLSSSMAHEVKNPLSSIKTIATVMAEELGPDHRHAEDLRLLRGEVDRLASKTTEWLEFIRPADVSEVVSTAGEVLGRTVRVLEYLAKKNNIVIETRLDENLPPVKANENALREIFFNLITNSLEAIVPGGRVTVTCSGEKDHVAVVVRDDGPGISPEVQDRLFEPFVTTKKKGTGLGLYVAAQRVCELGGEIRCQSEPGEGTCFTVKLPIQNR